LLIGAGLACALFLVDAWWIVQTRRNLVETEKKLSESFTALSDLNLQSALTVNPQSMLSELYPRLNEGLISIQESLEASPIEAASQEVLVVTEKVGRDLKLIEDQAAVFCAFDAADSAQHNLNRLATALSGVLDARLVSFFSYFESALTILPQGVSGASEGPTIEWKEGPLFDALNASRRIVSSNTLVLSSEEQQLLAPVIQGSYLAVPLLDDQRLLGAVVLSDKPSGISAADEELIGALQAVLSKVVQNIYQCDGLSKLNQLRREYCFELAKAIEAPLDRIRTEVQSIYDRLGKLTPYYKQHCETILFEVGKLYEMLREVRENETAAESKPVEQAPSSEVVLATVEKKEER
jgi:GAF domain-containing protein